MPSPTVVMMVTPEARALLTRSADTAVPIVVSSEGQTKQLQQLARGKVVADVAKIPPDAQRSFDRGMVHVQQGSLDLAIKEFSSAIDAAPKYAAAFSNRGVAQLRQKNFGRALDDFKKAIEFEPQNPVWHYNLAA